MAGEVPLEKIYGRRLEMIRPSAGDVERVGNQYIEQRIPGVEDVVRKLREAGVEVRVISGGLRPAVLVLTRFLGLEDEAVEAVDLRFDSDGNYAGFDEASPLARAGGKSEILRRWQEETSGPRMLVGDGATDLEGKGEVDLFVAFTGVVHRAAVAAGADVVIDGLSLDPIVPLALGSSGQSTDTGTQLNDH
jgi:phosphoserine phosphatase